MGGGSERTYLHCEDLDRIEQGFNKVMEQEGFCRISVLTPLMNTLKLSPYKALFEGVIWTRVIPIIS